MYFQYIGIFISSDAFAPLHNRKRIYFLCVTHENILQQNAQNPSHAITTMSSYFDGVQPPCQCGIVTSVYVHCLGFQC